jgi:hypothetical protein
MYCLNIDASTNGTSSIKPFNVGLTGGIGIAQKLGYGKLFFDIRGAYGLVSAQRYSQNGDSHSGYILLALGYSIKL